MNPENPFAEPFTNVSSPLPNSPVPPDTAELAARTGSKPFPVWGLLDVGFVLVFAVVAMVFCSLLSWVVAHFVPQLRDLKPEQLSMDPRVILSAQLAGYLLTFAFFHRLVSHHYGEPFWEAVRWRWPRQWPVFLVGGTLLAVAISSIGKLLPMPQEMPIDQFFSNPAGAWSVALFGVFIAPLAEEMFFRGLLFPALQHSWGLLTGLVLTSVAFALVHASQLGWSWAALLLMFIVGLTLTLVRARANSLAASVLVHMGYNGVLFAGLYFGTKGFHDFPVPGK